MSRIWHWIKGGKEWAIVTSWKSNREDEAPCSNCNRERLRLFFADLRRHGFGAIAMEGVGQEHGAMSYEYSFFIPNTTDRSEKQFHSVIEGIARKYNQFGYIVYVPSRGEVILFVDTGIYVEYDKWDYVSFTEKDLIMANKELVKLQTVEDKYDYSEEDKHISKFQPSYVGRRLSLRIDPRTLVGKRRRDKVLYYESNVERGFSIIEGMGGCKKENKRVWRYLRIVRPFFRPFLVD